MKTNLVILIIVGALTFLSGTSGASDCYADASVCAPTTTETTITVPSTTVVEVEEPIDELAHTGWTAPWLLAQGAILFIGVGGAMVIASRHGRK